MLQPVVDRLQPHMHELRRMFMLACTATRWTWSTRIEWGGETKAWTRGDAARCCPQGPACPRHCNLETPCNLLSPGWPLCLVCS